jgi:type IV pilus assembly protein PilF
MRLSGMTISIKHIFTLSSLLCALCVTSCATAPSPEKINEAEAHNKMGNSYFSSGQLNEAYAEFQKAIMINPRNKEALNQLGYISALFKNHDEAVSYYKRAIAVDPEYSDAMNNLGVLYLDVGNWDEAIKWFRNALKNPLYRSPEKAYTSMGYAYYRKGEYPTAEKALRDALARNPLYPVADYTLGLIYVKQGNDDTAIGEFKKAIGIMPDYMEAHWALAHAYLRTGKNDEALVHFKIIAKKDSDVKRSREALEYLELLR